MPGIGWEDRLLLKEGSYSTLASVEDGLSCRPSFSYFKLPQQLLNLSVLKLDGSTFDVQVSRSATIAELKQAVEEVFNHCPNLKGEGDISWAHVWGHFCLCYDGHKLINDKESLCIFGIKDGDQLVFKRHLSINHNPVRRTSRNHRTSCRQKRMSSAGSGIFEEKVENDADDNEDDDDLEEHIIHHGNECFFIKNAEFKLVHFLKGWLSFSRLWYRRLRLEGRTYSLKLDRN